MDLLDLSFAELLGLTRMDGYFSTYFSAFLEPLFPSNEGENKWIIDETVDFMEYARYLQRIYPSHAIIRDKESLNSSTQAKLEQQV